MKWQRYPAYETLVVPFVCDGDVAVVAEFENWSIDFGNIRRQITLGEMVERYNQDHQMLVRTEEGVKIRGSFSYVIDYTSLYPSDEYLMAYANYERLVSSLETTKGAIKICLKVGKTGMLLTLYDMEIQNERRIKEAIEELDRIYEKRGS